MRTADAAITATAAICTIGAYSGWYCFITAHSTHTDTASAAVLIISAISATEHAVDGIEQLRKIRQQHDKHGGYTRQNGYQRIIIPTRS